MAMTRRTFLSLAGSTALGVKAGSALPSAFQAPRFAYIAAKGNASGLYVFAPREPEWRLLQFVPAEEPVALAIHPDWRTLYVLHEVAIFRTLPRGYVSAYRIDALSAKPVLLAVQPLSLSATFPRHFAISPHGRLPDRLRPRWRSIQFFPHLRGWVHRPCLRHPQGSWLRSVFPLPAFSAPAGGSIHQGRELHSYSRSRERHDQSPRRRPISARACALCTASRHRRAFSGDAPRFANCVRLRRSLPGTSHLSI